MKLGPIIGQNMMMQHLLLSNKELEIPNVKKEEIGIKHYILVRLTARRIMMRGGDKMRTYLIPKHCVGS